MVRPMAAGAVSTSTDAIVLGAQEQAVLAVLIEHHRRAVSRRELSWAAGLAALSERRCDSLIVSIRRALGNDAVVTVRSRGWMLAPSAVDAARVLVGTCP